MAEERKDVQPENYADFLNDREITIVKTTNSGRKTIPKEAVKLNEFWRYSKLGSPFPG